MNRKDSFSLKFFIIPQPDKVNAKIFLRITVDRKKAEIYTGSTIEIDMWDEASNQAKSSRLGLNYAIDSRYVSATNRH